MKGQVKGGHKKPAYIRPDGKYDLVKALGRENLEYLIAKKSIGPRTKLRDFCVSKSLYYLFKQQLQRLKREDELAAVVRNAKKSAAKMQKIAKLNRNKLKCRAVDPIYINGLYEHDDGPVALSTTTSSSSSASSSGDEETKSLSSGSASSLNELSVSDKFALPAAAKKRKLVVSEQEVNTSQSPSIPSTSAAEEEVGEADNNYSLHALDEEYMNLGSNNNRAVSPDRLKETIIQYMAEINQKELDYNQSSTDCSLDDNPPASKRKQNTMLHSFNQHGHNSNDIRNKPLFLDLVIERAVSDKQEESESKSETGNSSSSSDEDEEPFNDDELPAKEAAIIQDHAAFVNNFFSKYAENEIADNDAAVDNEEKVISPDDLHNLKSVMDLEIKVRMKDIAAKHPKKEITWDNLLKHVFSHLNLPESKTTFVLQMLLSINGAIASSNGNCQIGVHVSLNKNYISILYTYICITYLYRPIPCGEFGTYAHYGLLAGLLGFSIGSISKDIRFYLDELVTRFPEYFAKTVIDTKPSFVTGKRNKYNKDLLKWRWQVIRRKAESVAAAAALKRSYLCTEAVSENVPDSLAVTLAEIPALKEIACSDAVKNTEQSADEVDEQEVLEEVEFEDLQYHLSNNEHSPRNLDVNLGGSDDSNEDFSDADDEAEAETDSNEQNCPMPSNFPSVKKKKLITVSSESRPATTAATATTEKYKIPSKATKKRVLGYNVSDLSNSDLYSTNEERPEHMFRKSTSEDSVDEGVDANEVYKRFIAIGQKQNHCQKCKGSNKIPHLVYEVSADGVQIQKKAAKSACWPIMGQLLYISPCTHLENCVRFYMPRNSKPVIIGFYHGTAKPSCPNQFLKCIFKEMKLAYKRRLCTMFLKFFIGDGPARQFIKGFPSSNAYCGCERCGERGVSLCKGINKKTGGPRRGHLSIVPTRNLLMRTKKNYLDADMYHKKVPDPHNILLMYSKQTEGRFNILHSIPLDAMHTVYSCAVPWLFHYTWIDGKKVKGGKFSKALMDSLELKLKKVKGCLPYAIQVNIGTKPFKKFGITWSCAEKRIFLLYVAIVILRHPLMKAEAYKILLAFQHAVMLLVGSGHNSKVPKEHLRKARENLLYLVVWR
nr:uncharacterized protein LOC124817116 [Hydra vulgaris]